MRLPGHQVRKSKAWPAKWLIESDTKIMQGDLRRQARLKSAEIMRPFAIEAEGMPELLIHGLHDLAYSRPRRRRLGHGTRLWRFGGSGPGPPEALHQGWWVACPSKPLSTTYGPQWA